MHNSQNLAWQWKLLFKLATNKYPDKLNKNLITIMIIITIIHSPEKEDELVYHHSTATLQKSNRRRPEGVKV